MRPCTRSFSLTGMKSQQHQHEVNLGLGRAKSRPKNPGQQNSKPSRSVRLEQVSISSPGRKNQKQNKIDDNTRALIIARKQSLRSFRSTIENPKNNAAISETRSQLQVGQETIMEPSSEMEPPPEVEVMLKRNVQISKSGRGNRQLEKRKCNKENKSLNKLTKKAVFKAESKKMEVEESVPVNSDTEAANVKISYDGPAAIVQEQETRIVTEDHEALHRKPIIYYDDIPDEFLWLTIENKQYDHLIELPIPFNNA